MQANVEKTTALLERTPATLHALLHGMPAAWTEINEGPDTWSPATVVAHLIQGEHEDWVPRTRHILQFGDSQAFSPFEMEGHARYSRNRTLDQLLDDFTQARAKGLEELRALRLTEKDLERKGLHPELGAITLSQHLATWAAHDLTHLHQISRMMAIQYREAVGPWRKFLGVMQCAGHSEAG